MFGLLKIDDIGTPLEQLKGKKERIRIILRAMKKLLAHIPSQMIHVKNLTSIPNLDFIQKFSHEW